MSLSDPVTKQDLQELESRLEAKADQNHLDLAARLERAETTLLDGFRNYATRASARTASIEFRLNSLEQEVLDLRTQLGSRPPEKSQ